jgi:hypothetical protein
MARKKRIPAAEEHTASTASVMASGKKRSAEIFPTSVSTQEKIALLAYTYWEQRGRTGGSPEEDWFRAEQEIFSRMSVEGQ